MDPWACGQMGRWADVQGKENNQVVKVKGVAGKESCVFQCREMNDDSHVRLLLPCHLRHGTIPE